jgi:hypothetical protein
MLGLTIRLYVASYLPVYGSLLTMRIAHTAIGKVVGRVPDQPHYYLVQFYEGKTFTAPLEVHHSEMEIIE